MKKNVNIKALVISILIIVYIISAFVEGLVFNSMYLFAGFALVITIMLILGFTYIIYDLLKDIV